MSSDIVQLAHQTPGQLPLDAETPLLDVGRRSCGIDSAYAHTTEQSWLGGIQGIGRETILQKKQRRSRIRFYRLYVIDQEGSVQCELILATEAFEQHVVDPIAGAKHGFRCHGIRQSNSGREIALVDLDECAFFE